MSGKYIAVLTPNLINGFAAGILWSIQGQSLETDYDTIIYCMVTAQARGRELYFYEKILKEKKISAMIAIGVPVAEDVMKRFKDAGIGVVLIEGRAKGAYRVAVDNESGAYEATKHLISRGSRKIGVVAGEVKKVASQRERFMGYLKALDENGVAYDQRLLWTVEKFNYKSGKEALRFMIMNDADSLFCMAGDYVSYGIIGEAKKQGINIPGQISLVGFDDIQMSEDLDLTTIRQPLEEMGKKAFEFAVKSIEAPENEPEEVILPVELIVRETA